MNALEVSAGKLVAIYLSGRETPKDVPGADDMTVDFDIVLPDGRIVALEITSSADERVLSPLAAGSRRRSSAPGLTNDWQIGVAHDKGVIVTQVMREMLKLLEVYERSGLTEVDTWSDPRWSRSLSALSSDAAAAAQRQFDLGLVVARSFGPRQGSAPEIYMTAHGGVTANVERMNELVAADSNRKKLAAAGADERHLFVWLNPSHADTELAVATLPPPPAPPALPQDVHVVWVATQGGRGFGDVQLERLWRVRAPGGWQRLDPSI